MKQKTAAILIAFLASVTLLTGCGDDVYHQYYTEECTHDYAAMDSYYYTITVNEWQTLPDGDGPYYFAECSMPELTNYVLDNGVVLCYLIDQGSDNLLPYLRPWDINEYGEPYFQNVRFDMVQGKITFIIEASDLVLPNYPIADMTFKVVVIQNFAH